MNDWRKKWQKDCGDIFKSAESILEQDNKIVSISPAADLVISGVPEGSWVILSGAPKSGKGQPLYSKIYTPNGPVLMKDIKPNDIVCTPNGKTAKVLDVFPQGEQDVYRIYFKNGKYADCDENHLWLIFDNNKRREEVINTKELLQRRIFHIHKGYKKYNISVPISIAEFNERYVEIHPYGLGVCLKDKPLNQKHIPEDYIYNSLENRKLLICGLMDTDGSISQSKLGHACGIFNTSSAILAKQFKYLIESIGGSCKIRSRYTFYVYKNKKLRGRKSYRCYIKYHNLKELVTLPSKRELIHQQVKKPKNFITQIKYLGKMHTQCIKLDSNDGLYVTDNFICTHNTSLALEIAKNGQLQYGKNVFYIDAEGRLKKMNITGVDGFIKEKCTIVQSTQDNILSAEKLLNITMDIIRNEKESIVIIDSTSALCAENELTSDITASSRASGPKLLASFCRQMGTVVPVQKTIVICIQHLIANTSGYGVPYMEDGGRKIQYQVDIKLRAKGIERWKDKEGKQIGQIVKWEVYSSALGSPGGDIENYIRYGKGIDIIQENIVLATDIGIIKQAGPWYSCEILGEKFQGQERLYDYLSNNKDKLNILYQEIKKHL